MLVGEEIRIKVLRSLLENAAVNKDKGPEYDAIIEMFATVKNKRNALVPGFGSLTKADEHLSRSRRPSTHSASWTNERLKRVS